MVNLLYHSSQFNLSHSLCIIIINAIQRQIGTVQDTLKEKVGHWRMAHQLRALADLPKNMTVNNFLKGSLLVSVWYADINANETAIYIK